MTGSHTSMGGSALSRASNWSSTSDWVQMLLGRCLLGRASRTERSGFLWPMMPSLWHIALGRCQQWSHPESMWWNACTHRLDLSFKSVWGMESEPMLPPREKSPLPEILPEEDLTNDAASSRTASPTHYQQAIWPLEYVQLFCSDPASYFHYRVCLTSLLRPTLLSLYYRVYLTSLFKPILLLLYYRACLTSLFRHIFSLSL